MIGTRLLADRVHRAAVQAGVQNTPTFFINGERSAASDWATLEPLLRGHGSGRTRGTDAAQ